MAARTGMYPGRNGLKMSDPRATPPNPVVPTGARWIFEGQATDTVAGNTANQAIGFATLASGSTVGRHSVTVNNTLIAAASTVRIWVQNQSADATAGLFIVAWEGSNAARVVGTSFALEWYSSGTLAADWVAGYEIIG